MANENNFGSVKHDIGCSDFFGPDCARIIAAETFGIGAIKNREAQIDVDPRIVINIETTGRVKRQADVFAHDVFGIQRESRSQHHSA